MKLMIISFHFEYGEDIEFILDQHAIRDYVRFPMLEGKDRDGKHFGNQVFPGNVTVVQAQVEDRAVEELFQDLKSFKQSKDSHRHLQAVLLPVEDQLLD
jgi:hypothetical protein